jgi:SNF family Na+-dependent transporter
MASPLIISISQGIWAWVMNDVNTKNKKVVAVVFIVISIHYFVNISKDVAKVGQIIEAFYNAEERFFWKKCFDLSRSHLKNILSPFSASFALILRCFFCSDSLRYELQKAPCLITKYLKNE